jgi:hypothetical protein
MLWMTAKRMRIESTTMATSTPYRPPAAPKRELPTAPRSTFTNDYVVLSAAAAQALVQAPKIANIMGAFALTIGVANGSLRVGPAAIEGMVHVQLDLQSVPGWPAVNGPLRTLHLEADLRGTWVNRVTADTPSNDAAAQQLAAAVIAVAQVPGQKTVHVDFEAANAAPPAAAVARA